MSLQRSLLAGARHRPVHNHLLARSETFALLVSAFNRHPLEPRLTTPLPPVLPSPWTAFELPMYESLVCRLKLLSLS